MRGRLRHGYACLAPRVIENTWNPYGRPRVTLTETLIRSPLIGNLIAMRRAFSTSNVETRAVGWIVEAALVAD